jgi:hypothetical protein
LFGASVTAPLALWHPRSFLNSAYIMQIHAPFRQDSVSFLAWWAHTRHVQPPSWIGFAAAVVSLGIALWRCPRTASGFATGLGFFYLMFFAFGRQAFTNYYTFILVALLLAISTTNPDEPIVGEGTGQDGSLQGERAGTAQDS